MRLLTRRFDAFRFEKKTVWGHSIVIDESGLSRSFFVFWSTQREAFDEALARDIAERIARQWGARVVGIWPEAHSRQARELREKEGRAYEWRAAFSY